MNEKLGKRLLYLGVPAAGIAFCLYYLSIATEDVAYTDYMRLIVSYLPDVANPAKFFVPDVLTRVPITYLGRIINVALFHYSTVFDMVLGGSQPRPRRPGPGLLLQGQKGLRPLVSGYHAFDVQPEQMGDVRQWKRLGVLFIHRRILLEFCHLRQDSVRQGEEI